MAPPADAVAATTRVNSPDVGVARNHVPHQKGVVSHREITSDADNNNMMKSMENEIKLLRNEVKASRSETKSYNDDVMMLLSSNQVGRDLMQSASKNKNQLMAAPNNRLMDLK